MTLMKNTIRVLLLIMLSPLVLVGIIACLIWLGLVIGFHLVDQFIDWL